MKTVMEAIGGERFEEMAQKMADLDTLQGQNIAMLGTMCTGASNELRDKALSQDQSFNTVFDRLNKLDQKVLHASMSYVEPEPLRQGIPFQVADSRPVWVEA